MTKANYYKKTISKGRWDEWYSKLPSYFLLGRVDSGMNSSVTVGFLSGEDVAPIDCQRMTTEELFAFDDYRKAMNITPRIYQDESALPDFDREEKESACNELDKLRLKLGFIRKKKALDNKLSRIYNGDIKS